jgi:hypothetical protein
MAGPMRLYICIFLFLGFGCFAQDAKPEPRRSMTEKPKEDPKATIDQYRIITLQRDTTYVDTSLTIQSEYRFNYLRRDIFGLMPFANEGQPYNVLDFSLNEFSPFPEFGYKAKHFNYLKASQIRYYSVATPFTELYFKSVMEQGQNLDAFITLNTSERLNFSIAYKGLRSLGKYINQLSSTGNFRFTTSYNSLGQRYVANFHFTAQDILNGENGGITTEEDFEGGDDSFKDRARLEVYFKDAKSFLKGKQLFLDHSFRINSKDASNNIYIGHQVNYEYKFFEYSQNVIPTTLTADDGTTTQIIRFGDSYATSNIKDQVRYNKLYNKVGATYESKLLGKFTFFVEDFRYNYYYDRVLVLESGAIPGLLSDEINTIGGQYEYRKNRWKGRFTYSNSIPDTPMSNLDASLQFSVNEKNWMTFQYLNISKIPNNIYNLHQSSYKSYNWANDFFNEKINTLRATANTQWITASVELSTYNDLLFFSDDDPSPRVELVSPKQYDHTINYLAVKAGHDFHFRKFGLDVTVLYQKADQQDDILNVPEILTRNTLYFSNYYFKKALYLQTGVTLNYFTKYFANGYNPILGEFFVQNQKEIGEFPMLDFFINARIRQTRIYLKAEHFNSAWTGNDFYSAPGYPYRDFTVRFGLVWNFFQ